MAVAWSERVACLVLAASTCGCIMTSKPVFGPDSRATPVPVGTVFDVYNRNSPDLEWTKEAETQTLTADSDGSLRMSKPSGSSEPFSLHKIGADLYVGQMIAHDAKRTSYVYATIRYRDGEAVMTFLECDKLDTANFNSLGGVVTGRTIHECSLDGVADRAGVLKGLALSKSTSPQTRYVVRPKP